MKLIVQHLKYKMLIAKYINRFYKQLNLINLNNNIIITYFKRSPIYNYKTKFIYYR